MKSRQVRLALLGLALGVLLALAFAPQTGWLVRPQIVPSLAQDAQRQRQFVQSHPNDYPVQLGGKPDQPPQTQWQYARSLVPRFPDNPSLRANILRYATTDLHLNRQDSGGYLLQGKPDPPPIHDPNRPPPTPAQLAAFDADAAAGERLDPDNAYFPFMRSIGLFAAHQDAEGQAAIGRAGTKTAWREYYEDEVEGRWRILDGIYGHREAVASVAISAALLFPQYAPLRAVARLVTVQAVKAEQAGHQEEGLTLRRSLARCGDLMRSQGTTYIANLVGIAINMISRSRPGGAVPITAPPGASTSPDINEQFAQKRLDAYCEYVTRIGHPDAAREARAQAAAADQARFRDFGDIIFGSRLQHLTRLAFSLVAGWALSANLPLFLLLGAAAWGLGHLPRIQQRVSLPSGAAVGACTVLFLTLVGVLGQLGSLEAGQTDFWGTLFTLTILGLIPLAAFSLYALFRPGFRPTFTQAIRAGLITLVPLAVLAGLAAWEGNEIKEQIAAMQMLSGTSSGQDASPSSAWLTTLLGLACLSALPLLMALVLSIAARVRRVPVSVGLVEGFRAWTPVVVCALAVLYGGLTLWTVRQESAVNYDLERSVHGEGQYLAQITGKPWPGPVR